MTAGIAARLGRLDPAWRQSVSVYADVRFLLAAPAMLVVLVYPGSFDPQSAYRERLGFAAADMVLGKALWGMFLRCACFDLEPEITAQLLVAGYGVDQVPIRYTPRTVREGKMLSWVDGFEAIYTLLRCRIEARPR